MNSGKTKTGRVGGKGEREVSRKRTMKERKKGSKLKRRKRIEEREEEEMGKEQELISRHLCNALGYHNNNKQL